MMFSFLLTLHLIRQIFDAETVRVVVTKPSKDTKLGLKISREAHGSEKILICLIHPGSLFEGTDLTAGMVFTSINGMTYSSYEEGLSLIADVEGELSVTVKPSQRQE